MSQAVWPSGEPQAMDACPGHLPGYYFKLTDFRFGRMSDDSDRMAVNFIGAASMCYQTF